MTDINLAADAKATVHNLEDLLTGKTDFKGFAAGEVAIFKADIAKLAPPLQATATAAVHDFEVAGSALVGAGKTALGPILAKSSDEQATMLLNLMSLAGLPTKGPLSVAEQVALRALIDAAKAGLDRMGVRFATAQPAVDNAVRMAA